jgi:hypothetical protein
MARCCHARSPDGRFAIAGGKVVEVRMARYDSFILRIWSEAGLCIHGYVTHVTSAERTPFATLDRMTEIVQERIEHEAEKPDATDPSAPRDEA